ncbi:hypothetical protein L2E82_39940 [Cichorium intybus]|uniref:Uncharacterized protein n=1 Tax=Cichorium intybus TaxID=13427 RepID=A0ACB9AJM8_CICIN|nr:hypothetical protein L2E82_39940 [Cichorium intybus]
MVDSRSATSLTLNDQIMLIKHEKWMARHARVYTDEKEKQLRFQIFKNNVAIINAHNGRPNQGYKLEVNKFADLTNNEFRASRNGYRKQPDSRTMSGFFRYANVTAVPDELDWRKLGAVTPIKDQGDCGCEGGLMNNAFQFIEKRKGLTAASVYPYTGEDGTCNTKKAAIPAAKISGHEKVPANNEKALLQAVANQPVSIAIDASADAFQFYSFGIFNGTCGTKLDHAMTIVGYGTTTDGANLMAHRPACHDPTTLGSPGISQQKRNLNQYLHCKNCTHYNISPEIESESYLLLRRCRRLEQKTMMVAEKGCELLLAKQKFDLTKREGKKGCCDSVYSSSCTSLGDQLE